MGVWGQLEGSPNGRIASATTVHGRRPQEAAWLIRRAGSGTGATPAIERGARRSRCVVRECQWHDMLGRGDTAPSGALSA
jgi:hypothetical protein